MTDQDDLRFVTAAFSELDDVEASATLRRQVAQIPIEHPRFEKSPWPFAKVWQTVFAFVALGAVGVFTGNVTHGSSSDSSLAAVTLERDDDASEDPVDETLQEGELDEEAQALEGLFALALSDDWESWERDESWEVSDEWESTGSSATAPRPLEVLQ